jgi:methylation protein MtfA
MAKRRRGEESKSRKDPDPSGQYDAIAELYDGYPGDYAEDILFFAEEAKTAGSPVLEIGAGTGRLSFCLAAVGVDVVALDSSRPMLEVLRARQAQREHLPGRVWPVVADMRDFALTRESLWDGVAHPNRITELSRSRTAR